MVKLTVETDRAGRERDRVTIRFAGDSGDGMQLAGNRFTDSTALFGNDFSTLPDFPAEIRAPAGSLAGVSAFQISFSNQRIHTPGDAPDTLIAMNPAALKMNLGDLPRGGLIIVNEEAFTTTNLKKAGYAANPLGDGSLSDYRIISVPLTKLAVEAAREFPVSVQQAERTRNLAALGLVCWLYGRDLESTLQWVAVKFERNPAIVQANQSALRAGYNYGETAELADASVRVGPAKLPPGEYRNITGNQATSLGIVAAAHLSGQSVVYASYPITPASEILELLASYRNFGVKTVQAEDEIAAAGVALGAAFGGALGLTGTSGPGLALKAETVGLAVSTELPLVILDIQRAGPSTGMPTKTEQGDLLQAFFGRNSESPVCIVAPSSPGDCFYLAIEAIRIAQKYMTPVIFLSDTYLGNTSEPWIVPAIDEIAPIVIRHHTDPEGFAPFIRDSETLARPYALPGTPGLEHRVGGLEKADGSGDVSYDPLNHQRMVDLRAEKIERIAQDVPALEVEGPQEGDVLVLGWGSTRGAILSAADQARAEGVPVSTAHLRYLNPFPHNLGAVLRRFRRVLIPENNSGQLRLLIRAKYLIDAHGLNKVMGKPFTAVEIAEGIIQLSEESRGR
ncbi:MAG: 2-oxoacid:acceptor oxidoreductase subunit alpha [Chloroflexi bacterium]|nr:2-oxoacid:acceptor oxidoreductase subunit alpha [Chloroflexota bacterium]